jgi:hypothetical protein
MPLYRWPWRYDGFATAKSRSVGLPNISNNVGPVKHFLGTLLYSHKRVFSSASFGAFPIGPNKYGSFVI